MFSYHNVDTRDLGGNVCALGPTEGQCLMPTALLLSEAGEVVEAAVLRPGDQLRSFSGGSREELSFSAVAVEAARPVLPARLHGVFTAFLDPGAAGGAERRWRFGLGATLKSICAAASSFTSSSRIFSTFAWDVLRFAVALGSALGGPPAGVTGLTVMPASRARCALSGSEEAAPPLLPAPRPVWGRRSAAISSASLTAAALPELFPFLTMVGSKASPTTSKLVV